VDLSSLDVVVAEFADAWSSAGVRREVIHFPPRDKAAAALRLETPGALGEVILWASGEADASWASKRQGPVGVDHYEVSSSLGLRGCISDPNAARRLRRTTGRAGRSVAPQMPPRGVRWLPTE